MDLPVPYVASSANYGFKIIQKLLRQAGGFFLGKNKNENAKIYDAIVSEYLQYLLKDINGPFIEFFLERSRTRTGKIG